MKKVVLSVLMFSMTVSFARAHCQVPCGVYTDEMRFTMIEENLKTIEKAMMHIAKFAKSSDPADTAKAIRWTVTKEEHAVDIQRIVCDYFMTQRIKPNAAQYIRKITSLHQLLIAAMKCRQSVDVSTVAVARDVTASFHALYFPEPAKDAHTKKHDHSGHDHSGHKH